MQALPLEQRSVLRLPPSQKRMPSGFSLIELLVVITIMGILIALGIASLSSPKGAREVSQAGAMVSDLARLARQYALAKNTRTVLVFAPVTDGGDTRYAVSIWDGATTNQLERWNLLPTSISVTNTSASPGSMPGSLTGVKFRNQTVTQSAVYWFYPDGRMGDNLQNAPKVKIQRGSDSANTYELIFNPVTGLAKDYRP